MNQTFKLSLKPDDYPPRVPVVYANQYDVGRPFQATILDVDDSEYTFTNETVAICGTKPDGTGFSYDVTASGHVVTFTTTGQMTVVHGFVRCGIIITQGSTVIGTLAFLMYVQPAALQTGTIISSDDFGSIITDAVADWMDEHGVVIDNTLSVAGAAADAKKTGDEIADLKSHILSDTAKQALLACFSHVAAWDDGDGSEYIDALEDALYPPSTLVSISAVYTQSGTVYVTDTLNDLKSDLVVTAHYDDTTTETIDAAYYSLSGSLTGGENTITVSYNGKTTTFTVDVTRYVLYDYLYQSVAYEGTAQLEYVDTGLTYSPSFNVLNIEFEAVNKNTRNVTAALVTANNQIASDTGNVVWYARANKGGFSAYNLGVAKQLNTVPGDTRAVIKYFFVDGGQSYMQWESTTVDVASLAKSSVASNQNSLILAGGRQFSDVMQYGLAGGLSELGYIKFIDPSTDNLVYHFVPAHDLTTDKYGFYENVNDVFYPSNGTGFRCGNWS